MKATGIVRPLDSMGRVVIPKEIRRVLHIENTDSLEVFTEGDTIILKKYEPCCVFCNNTNDVSEFKGRLVCRECIAEMSGLVEVAE